MKLKHKKLKKQFEEIILTTDNLEFFSNQFIKYLDSLEKSFANELDNEEKKLIDCRAGCGYCCRVNISTLIPEAFNIFSYIMNSFEVEEIEKIKKKILDDYQQVRYLDDEERIVAGVKCPFLSHNNSCLIYPVRPILCRSVTSTSSERCEEAIVSAVFGDELPILMNLKQEEYYEVAYMGIVNILDSNSLDSRGVKLITALYHLFKKNYKYSDFIKGDDFPI